MANNVRPRDENGWRVPTEGTQSRRVYDMLKAGISVDEIKAQLGYAACTYIYAVQNPDTKAERAARHQARQAAMQASQPRPEPAPPRSLSSATIVSAADLPRSTVELRIADLERKIAVEEWQGVPHIIALERDRQFLLHLRLMQDMELFVKRFEPDEAERVWRHFIGGLYKWRDEIEQKCGRRMEFSEARQL